ncbi:hypothetical protein K438DRAFT_1966888 [Mycena galopus ATCC 62051]|nr:hypothetical protein K438DRAFT_1966888 [Mycena galopus ATCC 62051]
MSLKSLVETSAAPATDSEKKKCKKWHVLSMPLARMVLLMMHSSPPKSSLYLHYALPPSPAHLLDTTLSPHVQSTCIADVMGGAQGKGLCKIPEGLITAFILDSDVDSACPLLLGTNAVLHCSRGCITKLHPTHDTITTLVPCFKLSDIVSVLLGLPLFPTSSPAHSASPSSLRCVLCPPPTSLPPHLQSLLITKNLELPKLDTFNTMSAGACGLPDKARTASLMQLFRYNRPERSTRKKVVVEVHHDLGLLTLALGLDVCNAQGW